MRLLITGGTGFLGGRAAAAALAAGVEVAVLARRTPAGGASGILWIEGTLAAPDWRAIEAWAPEACLHAAWIATPGVYLESPENALWAQWSLDFLTRLAGMGLKHATVLGTCIEYAMTGRPCVEDATPPAPASPYARAKHELHERLRPRLADAGTGLAWARIFYPYGVGEHPARLASSLIARLRAGQPLRLRTPDSVKDYIHADDVGAALLRVAERRWDGAINVGTGVGVRVADLALTLASMLGRPDQVELGEAAADPLDYVVADVARLRALGWAPQVGLESGLRRLVEATAL